MRSMRTLLRFRTVQSLALCGTALSACVAFVVACGDNEASRPSFDAPDTGGPNNLPETGSPYDAGPAPDAMGKDPYSSEDEEVICATDGGPCVKQIVAGRNHFCARMAGGTVHCWGNDELGNLGRGMPKKEHDGGAEWKIPPVADVTGATQISAGADTTCARLDDGSIRCWGGNSSAELALTEESPPIKDWERHPDPVRPAGVGSAVRVDVGQGSVCAVLSDGKLWCWGRADLGQLARPVRRDSPLYGSPGPAEVDPLAIASAQSGTNSTLGLTTGGELWVWGALSGEDGYCSGVIASISPSIKPRKILELSKVTSFAVSEHFQPVAWPLEPPPQAHACAIANGNLYCWGRSDKTALCTGKPEREIVPAAAPVESKAWPQRVAVAREITCVRMTDGTVQCCGSNERGRMALPLQTTHSALLTPAANFKGRAVQVATSDASVCALVQGGTVECWGSNLNGELGTTDPDESDHPEPMLVSF
jgi:alpha-tubulin suppressor-like RCC1 family protein